MIYLILGFVLSIIYISISYVIRRANNTLSFDGVLYAMAFIPIVTLVILYYVMKDDIIDLREALNYYNKAYRCPSCRIVSREWQMLESNECPHCEVTLNKYTSNSVNSKVKRAFAKKLNIFTLIKLLLITKKLEIYKRIKKEEDGILHEIDSWNKLQEEKLLKMKIKEGV